ncbi:MAG: hypothetical protein ACLGJC_29785 [Alphaproteobacteria bacterium]
MIDAPGAGLSASGVTASGVQSSAKRVPVNFPITFPAELLYFHTINAAEAYNDRCQSCDFRSMIGLGMVKI